MKSKTINELFNLFESELCEAKSLYESYQEYEPIVSELEYLGYDDQDMQLHSYRGTMNQYYDEYCNALDKAGDIRKIIEDKIQNKNKEEQEEILDNLDMLELDYEV